MEKEDNEKNYKNNDNEKDDISKNIPNNIMELIRTKSLTNQSVYLSTISESSNCGPYFLEVYNKIAEKENWRKICKTCRPK